MNTDTNEKVKQNIYVKPNKSYYYQFYNSNTNYTNIFSDLLEENKIDKSKYIMISQLDIETNNISPNESLDNIEQNKDIKINKNNESKVEFKKQLTDNLINFIKKNQENKSFKDIIYNYNNKNTKSKEKDSLNLTSISPKNSRFKTLNVNKNDELKKCRKNYLIKINRRINNKKKSLAKNNPKTKENKENLIKKTQNINFKSIFEKFNCNTYKKIKNYNSIFNQPRKSHLLQGIKKIKNFPSIHDIKKKNSTNIKYKQNSSFMKDTNKSTTLKNSFKHSTAKSTFKQIKNNKLQISNSKPKDQLDNINKQLFPISKSKYTLTENNCNNTTKNISNKGYSTCNNFIKKKTIPNKYRNFTLKEIKSLNNNFINLRKNSFNKFFNTIFNKDKEKERNFSTIVYEKKKLKSPLNKKLKVHVRNNIKNSFYKNPINIVNININRNNNFVMNINNRHYINTINNNKFVNSSSKTEGKIRKFFSFHNFINLSENNHKNNLKKKSKEK